MIRSAPGLAPPRPETTARVRCGSHFSASRSHVSFSDAGQTTTAGHASSASSVASAWTVLPRPCSSAMNVRRASSAYRTPAHWNGASSPPSRAAISSSGSACLRARLADVLDGGVVLDPQPLDRRLRAGRHRDVVRAQEAVERLDHPRVHRQRAAARLGAGERDERGGGVGVPQRLEPEALLVDAVGEDELGARRPDADLQARRAAERGLVQARALLLEDRVGGLLA